MNFYDVFDGLREGIGGGWGIWGFWAERLFDSLDEARACRDRLNAELAEGNPSSVNLGEHFGIIDRTVSAEIECVRQRPLGVPVTELLE